MPKSLTKNALKATTFLTNTASLRHGSLVTEVRNSRLRFSSFRDPDWLLARAGGAQPVTCSADRDALLRRGVSTQLRSTVPLPPPDYYAPECERCIRRDDPDFNIEWLLTGEPLVSEKGRRGFVFARAEYFD